MKSLKNHLSVVISLFVLLFSLQFSFLLSNMVDNYSASLKDDYSIVAVSKKQLDKPVLKNRIDNIKSIESINSAKVLKYLEGNLSPKSIKNLKKSLPNFYSIKLNKFPSTKEIRSIKKELLESKLVYKVETFTKTHTRIYTMFMITKGVSSIFSAFILIVSLLLMAKQMHIWLLEHKKRMYIMSLFGATFWMKSAVLYKLVIIDSLLSTAAVALFYKVLLTNESIVAFVDDLQIKELEFHILADSGRLLVIALVLSLVIVSWVIRKINKQ